jgi:tRNA G18 (ribose-2'-O)-methylase SpoU
VEGARAVRQLLSSAWPVQSLLLSREQAAARPDLVAAAAEAGVPAYVAERGLLVAVVGFPFHRGVLGLGVRQADRPVGDVVEGASRLGLIEGVNDHENLGALFRNAAAFGVDGLLLDPTTADPLYRRSIRVSMGQVLRVPFARAADWPGVLSELRGAGFVVVALSPHGTETIADAAAALAGRRVATVVGADGPGLSAAALAGADRVVRIPISPAVDSLNVATAAAVAWHRLATSGSVYGERP